MNTAPEPDRLGYVDELTQLPNYRGLLEDFETRAEKGEPFALLMIDVQKFKQINERYGHNAGDQALRFVAGFLASGLRDEDEIYRIPDLDKVDNHSLVSRKGGDEFVIFLSAGSRTPRGETESINAKVARVQNRLYHNFKTDESVRAYNSTVSEDYQLGFHIGTAVYDPENPQPLRELLEEGDAKPLLSDRQRLAGRVVAMMFGAAADEYHHEPEAQ